MKRPHSHDAEWAPQTKPDTDLPIFAPPARGLTETEFHTKILRGLARYARANGGGRVTLSPDMCRYLYNHGVLIDLAPRGTLPNEATPDQCERYATELERAA